MKKFAALLALLAALCTPAAAQETFPTYLGSLTLATTPLLGTEQTYVLQNGFSRRTPVSSIQGTIPQGATCVNLNLFQQFVNTIGAPQFNTLNFWDGTQCVSWASINQTTHNILFQSPLTVGGPLQGQSGTITLNGATSGNTTITVTPTLGQLALGAANNQWFLNATGDVFVSSPSSAHPTLEMLNSTNDALAPAYLFVKQRGSGNTLINDVLGSIQFFGFANGGFQQSVFISAQQQAASSGSVIPSFFQVTTSSTSGNLVNNWFFNDIGNFQAANGSLVTGSNSGVSGAVIWFGSTSGSVTAAVNTTGSLINLTSTVSTGANFAATGSLASGSAGISSGILQLNGTTSGNTQLLVTSTGIFEVGSANGGTLFLAGGGTSAFAAFNGVTSGLMQIGTSATGGHLSFSGSGTAPTLTGGCNGTGSSINGTDIDMTFGNQTAAATSCTVTFGTAYASAPRCKPTGHTTPVTSYSTTTTTLTVNFASTAAAIFEAFCTF